MRSVRTVARWGSLLGIVAPLAACSEHHAPPSSRPIPAVTGAAVFVVNGGDSTVTVIDAATRSVAGTIELVNAPYPHHIYASPDRATLVIAVPGVDLAGGHGGGGHGGHGGATGAVMKLDATTGQTLAIAELATPNHNAIYAPSGTEVWTSQMDTVGQVLVLDATDLTLRQTLPAGAMPAEVTFSPDGARAFVANSGESTVSVFDVASKQAVQTITVGRTPVGAWPGRDGVMYVDNETDRTLSAVDPVTLLVVRTYDLGFTPAFAAVAPNGELWVTNTDTGSLVVFAAGGVARVAEVATGAGAHAIAFSDDGATAYVTNQVAGTVAVLDTATRVVQTTVVVGAGPNGVVFRAAI